MPDATGNVPDLTRDPQLEPTYTIRPLGATQLAFRVPPGTLCSIGLEGDAAALRVISSAGGMLRFGVYPSAMLPKPIRLLVDIGSGDQVEHRAVSLRLAADVADGWPLAPLLLEEPWPADRVRQPLSDDEMRSLEDGALLARGFPVRPDPNGPAEVYTAWRRAVSVPVAAVDPALVARPDVSSGAAVAAATTMWNWSGFELKSSPLMHRLRSGPAGPYDWVAGTWHVPNLTGHTMGEQRSSMWVGISDGDGNTDLWQAGTEHDIAGAADSSSPYTSGDVTVWLIGPPSLWTQFLPLQQTEQTVSGLNIAAGDEVYVQAWIGEEGSAPRLDGPTLFAYIQNNTTRQSALVSQPRGGTQIKGAEAEWIMERPTIEPPVFLPPLGYYALADYGTASMRGAAARRANEPPGTGVVRYLDDPGQQITMVDPSGAILSTVQAQTPSDMLFRYGPPVVLAQRDHIGAAGTLVSG